MSTPHILLTAEAITAAAVVSLGTDFFGWAGCVRRRGQVGLLGKGALQQPVRAHAKVDVIAVRFFVA